MSLLYCFSLSLSCTFCVSTSVCSPSLCSLPLFAYHLLFTLFGSALLFCHFLSLLSCPCFLLYPNCSHSLFAHRTLSSLASRPYEHHHREPKHFHGHSAGVHTRDQTTRGRSAGGRESDFNIHTHAHTNIHMLFKLVLHDITPILALKYKLTLNTHAHTGPSHSLQMVLGGCGRRGRGSCSCRIFRCLNCAAQAAQS